MHRGIMKKLLVVMALWSLSAFSGEGLPGESAVAVAEAKFAADRTAQEEAQKKLEEEEADEGFEQERVEKVQAAAQANPTDAPDQAAVTEAQKALVIVRDQVADDEQVVEEDTEG